MCEGYTDVIGFHRAGLRRAVATCGTAFTEEHVRLMKRFASRVVLAFDADKAGQGAAERFYEWEEKYQVQVSVARFPVARTPASSPSPTRRRCARRSTDALPFLGFRLRAGAGRPAAAHPGGPGPARRGCDGGGQRASQRRRAQALRRRGRAAEVGLPRRRPACASPSGGSAAPHESTPPSAASGRGRTPSSSPSPCWCSTGTTIAAWLVEALFADDVHRRAFLALAERTAI